MLQNSSKMLLWFTAFFSCIQNIFPAKEVPVDCVKVLLNDELRLPCDISLTDDPIIHKQEEEDSILLILWYKEDEGTPIFSIDARENNFENAGTWFDSRLMGRAYFTADTHPSNLVIKQAREDDAALYRCRVDFKLSQIRNSRVNVTVIVPPKRIVVLDENSIPKETVVGPYAEGATIILRCIVYGGKPTPHITWFKNKELITNSTALIMESKINSDNGKCGPGIMSQKNVREVIKHNRKRSNTDDPCVQSTMILKNLQRTDLHSELVCMATNYEKPAPLSVSLHLDMNFPPLNVVISDYGQPLTIQRRYELVCQSTGSRPPAKITWWINGKRLEKSRDTTSSDGNITTSTISIIPGEQDNGKYLSCLAENPILNKQLETGWNLEIHSVPRSKITLGTSLKADSIKEGMDVYFDCVINGFPPVHRIEWHKNNETLYHNLGAGIIISNHSLVLQSVTRNSTGNYTCTGYNSEGHGQSRSFFLNVMFSPTCKLNQTKVYGAAKRERVNITCEVEANPTDDVVFKWMFNNSADSTDVARHLIFTRNTVSVITHQALADTDYGTLLCIAKNRVGQQHSPCIFHVIAAGRPDRVSNCSINSTSPTQLAINCIEGFNGGIPQSFILQIHQQWDQLQVANVSAITPSFTLSTLQAGTRYVVSVFSVNKKGYSDPYIVEIVTEGNPPSHRSNKITENLTGKSSSRNFHINIVFSIVGGCVIAFILVLCCVTVTVLKGGGRCLKRSSHSGGRGNDKKLNYLNENKTADENDSPSSYKCKYADSSALTDIPTITVTPVSTVSDEERNPDLIPHIVAGECIIHDGDRNSKIGCNYYGGRRYVSVICDKESSSSAQQNTTSSIGSNSSGYFTTFSGKTNKNVPLNFQCSISNMNTSVFC